MGDYYDPSASGGYLGKPDVAPKKEAKSETSKTTIEGCGCVSALLIVCVTIIVLAMIFTGYHF